MKMKKVMAAILAGIMLTAVAACGESNSGEKTYKVGIIQQLEHQALNAATDGFRKALTDKLGDKVTFDYQNAQGEQSNLSPIATKFVTSRVDLILANATGALQASSSATSSIPVVGVSITDFKTALPSLFDDNNKPLGNVTGVSDLSPIDKQIDLLKKVCPNASQVAILYCSSEANSKYQADLAAKALDASGIAYKTYTFVDTNDLTPVVTQAVAECDTMYIPTDNTAADNMSLIKSITLGGDKKVPIVAGEENMCKSGGFVTLSGSYYDMGYRAGLMAYEILTGEKQVADIDVAYVTEGLVEKYNPEVAAELGITVPEDLVSLGE